MKEFKLVDRRNIMGQDFRVYGDAEYPLFLARDVAIWIEHSDVSTMLRTVDDEEKLTQTMFVSGQNREVWFLTEEGLYEVLMQSRKPMAKEFKRQVKRVLKEIRKYGIYVTTSKLEEMLRDPDTMIITLKALKAERERSRVLAIENAIMQPKAEYFDELVDRNLLTNFRDTAKELKVGEKNFIQFLIGSKYIYRDKKGKLKPYADSNYGLFEVKETMNEKNGWVGTQTFITPKGRETFRLILKNYREVM